MVLAASGDLYVELAKQVASSIKAHNPGLPVDLFCDDPEAEGPFDQVHVLSVPSRRPKFESALRSRFDRTIVMDVDLVITADISDMFWVLSKYDMAGVHVQNRNLGFAQRYRNQRFPNAFPQINGGVIAFRKNERTIAFFEKWQEQVMVINPGSADQPWLRELAWNEDVSICILPEEYNLRKTERLYFSNWTVPAPRILHSKKFVRAIKAGKDYSPRGAFGRFYMWLMRNQILGDRQLTAKEVREKSLMSRLFER